MSLEWSLNSSAHRSASTYFRLLVLWRLGSTLLVRHPQLLLAFGLCASTLVAPSTAVPARLACLACHLRCTATSEFKFRVPCAALCFAQVPSLCTTLCYHLLAPLIASAAAAAAFCCCSLLLLSSTGCLCCLTSSLLSFLHCCCCPQLHSFA